MSDTDFTVGDLRRQLKGYPDDFKISFDGGMHFNRLKTIADDEVFLEFAEIQADLSPSFRRKNPDIQVVFCRYAYEGGVVEVFHVPRL